MLQAKYSKDNQELEILQCIRSHEDQQHPGRKHLPTLLDHFFEGKNLFIVTQLMGPSIFDAINYIPKWRYSKSSARYTKQLLLAIDCLHSYGIVHGGMFT